MSQAAKVKQEKRPANESQIPIRCCHEKMVRTNQLRPNPLNPNTHPERQVERLAALIKEHGWRHPITVSRRSGFVASGHCRLLAAQRLGAREVPTDYQDFASDAEELAVLIADNTIAEIAELDEHKMADVLKQLGQSSYDLSLTGLDESQIEDYLNQLSIEPNEKDDQVPELPKIPITKTGDLWQLGGHRLLCGDSTDLQQAIRVTNG